MSLTREEINRSNSYKALLLYSLIGGCCVLNYMNYIETVNFNKELKKQVKICKKLLKNKVKTLS